MLTRKQYEMLEFIDQRIRIDGIPPSYEEMKEIFGMKSKSGIHRIILALEERGFIRRMPYRARAIEVIRKPAKMDPSNKGFVPTIVGGSDGPPAGGDTVKSPVHVPFYGKIAAGTPIEALRDTTRTFEATASMLGQGEHYALQIEGDSMIEAGIHDGDIALVKRTDAAENGQIVVALVDESEATLKRFRRRGASVALEPANPDHEIRIYGPDQVRVQGRLVGLVRTY